MGVYAVSFSSSLYGENSAETCLILNKKAHDPIVDLDDFMFACNRLSKTTLDGEINESKPTINRRSHKTEHRALLENVLQSDDKPANVMAGKGFYSAGNRSDGIRPSTEFSLPIDALDRDFSAAIRYLVAISMPGHQKK